MRYGIVLLYSNAVRTLWLDLRFPLTPGPGLRSEIMSRARPFATPVFSSSSPPIGPASE